ncbi:hypothetical protein VKT23_018418 [Stygiomarasmius scandens]|uniref:Ribonuclease H1 N-terminal domain-containing protein n=1 Tax=Marasmiellus scandens TaxID=2682957 RepID=A0ABR1ISK4_9AGAR
MRACNNGGLSGGLTMCQCDHGSIFLSLVTLKHPLSSRQTRLIDHGSGYPDQEERKGTSSANKHAVAALLEEHEILQEEGERRMAALRKEMDRLLNEETSNSSDLSDSDSDLYESDNGSELELVAVHLLSPTTRPPRTSTPPPSYASRLSYIPASPVPRTVEPQASSSHQPSLRPALNTQVTSSSSALAGPSHVAVPTTPNTNQGKCFRAYVVYHGRRKGAFGDWRSTNFIISGDADAVYKGFQTLELAKESYQLTHRSGVLNALDYQPERGEPHWVVIQGVHPGVYKSRYEVLRDGLYWGGGAVYTYNDVNDANAFFVAEYMANRVVVLRKSFEIVPL